MEKIWEMVDTRITDPESMAIGQRNTKLLFELNHTMPRTEEYFAKLRELFGDNLGETALLRHPFRASALKG